MKKFNLIFVNVLLIFMLLIGVIISSGIFCKMDLGINDINIFKTSNKNIKDHKYRKLMRDFIIEIGKYTKGIDKNFIIIQQNGETIINENLQEAKAYMDFIDGIAREDLNYGYIKSNVATESKIEENINSNLEYFKNNNKVVMIIDYCSSKNKVSHSYKENNRNGYISFAADGKELNNIPKVPKEPYNINSNDVMKLYQAKNFLYIINPSKFKNKEEFLKRISKTNYDVIIMDLFLNSKEEKFTREEINRLKSKNNGGKRLVLCYMSIGEAEEYRYYWNESWQVNKPSWLKEENKEWSGNYTVKYWDKSWQSIIYGNDKSYSKQILDAGFHGVYLDLVDSYYYFENQEKK